MSSPSFHFLCARFFTSAFATFSPLSPYFGFSVCSVVSLFSSGLSFLECCGLEFLPARALFRILLHAASIRPLALEFLRSFKPLSWRSGGELLATPHVRSEAALPIKLVSCFCLCIMMLRAGPQSLSRPLFFPSGN